MNSNVSRRCSSTYFFYDSRFLIEKKTISIVLLTALFVTEVFSGALRYYLHSMGFVFLIYIPKAVCLVFIFMEFFVIQYTFLSIWCFFVFFISCVIGLLNNTNLNNIAFGLYAYAPFFFGVIYGRFIIDKRKELYYIIFFLFLMSILGVFLDAYIAVPWKGFSYAIGGSEIEANREWAYAGVDRLAGFARISSVLAILLSIFSLYLCRVLNSCMMKLFISSLTVYALVLTTNKSAVPAYIVALLIGLPLSYYIRPLVFVVSVLMGVALPLSTVFIKFMNDGGNDLLISLYMRLVDTWPDYIYLITSLKADLVGLGFGAVGAAFSTFPITTLSGNGLITPAVSDNTALYLWGMFGLLGIFLYLMQLPLMFLLNKVQDVYMKSLMEISLFICICSWTTDMLESAISSFFVGLSIYVAFVIYKGNLDNI